MSKQITFKDKEITFPAACVYCQRPVKNSWDLTRTIRYSTRYTSVEFNVPLCAEHHAIAAHKNPAEQLVGRIAIALGAIAGPGVGVAHILAMPYRDTFSALVTTLMTLFLCAIVFFITWQSLTFYVAPHFADPETKDVRAAVRIRKYSPFTMEVQLDFANDAVAVAVVAANPGRVLKQE